MNIRLFGQRVGGGVMQLARIGLLALLLMSALRRAPAVPVRAGSPTLTASENPLIIPFGQQSKSFKISWDSGNGGPVELWGVLNGGSELGPYPAPAVGSSTNTLNYGDVWTIRMYTPGKKDVLAALTITTSRADMPVPPAVSCAEKRITSVDVDPHGTFANSISSPRAS